MAKYDPLRELLINNQSPKVRLTFEEIASLVGGLPPTAFDRDEWWSNEDHRMTRHVQCKAWGQAGYSASADRRAQITTFERI